MKGEKIRVPGQWRLCTILPDPGGTAADVHVRVPPPSVRQPDSPPPKNSYSEPAILWRMRSPSGEIVEATALPVMQGCGLVLKKNKTVRRAIECSGLGVALVRAERLAKRLRGRGWTPID